MAPNVERHAPIAYAMERHDGDLAAQAMLAVIGAGLDRAAGKRV